MSRKQIEFTEIIQMIADGTVPEGAKFVRDGGTATVRATGLSLLDALIWESGDPVSISTYNLSTAWHMELPDRQQLTLAEAVSQWADGNLVEVEHCGICFKLSGFTPIEDIYNDTPLYDLDDLLTCSKFYKVTD